jgi:hypothetical protein
VHHRLRAAILTVALCLSTAASASASTEFGNRCTGNATRSGATVLGLANGEEPTFPGTAGPWELRWTQQAVITRWKIQMGPGLGPLPQQLVAFNYASEEEARNLGESAVETLVEGTNEFATRIPIPEYAHIGLRGPSGTLYCDATQMGAIGVVEGDFPVGTVRPFEMLFPDGVPVVAIAEPDADGDGYGDETQDQCALSPRFQGPCPFITLDGWVAELRPGAILVNVMTNTDTQVEVTGTIAMPRAPKRKRDAERSKATGIRTFDLAAGRQQVAAGVPAMFRLSLPRAVVRQLNGMARKDRLKLLVRMRRPLSEQESLPGSVITSFNVKLPGRERRSVRH